MSFYFYTCGNSILGGIADCHPLILLEGSLVGALLLFVCIYFVGVFFNDCFHCVCFLVNLSMKEELNLVAVLDFLHNILKLNYFAFALQCHSNFYFISY